MILNMSGGAGGASLNFDVKAYASEAALPATAKENTIAIITDTAITSYDFSATKPQRRSVNKNMLVYPYFSNTRTVNGITFTDNSDGTITANGTATADATLYLEDNFNLPAGEYCISGAVSENSFVGMKVTFADGTVSYFTTDKTGGFSFTLDKAATTMVYLRVSAGQTVSNIVFKPQIEKAAASTPFVKGDATGQVWIATGTTSPAEFNVLKKNSIHLYPMSAMQYVDGAWVSVTAKSYIGGEWVNWWNGELYDAGDEFAGWSYVPMAIASTYTAYAEPEVEKGASSMTITQNAYTTSCAYVYNDEVDLTTFDKLVFDGKLYTAMTAWASAACLCIWTKLGTYVEDYRVAYINFSTAEPKIDVADMTGKHRIGFFLFSQGSYAQVNSLLLE